MYLRQRGSDLGISVLDHPPSCQKCLQFAYGLKVRPFPEGLIEAPEQRLSRMDGQGVTRQVLSGWTDIFGYGLPVSKGRDWHRLMNDALGSWCEQHADRFSWLASGALPDAAAAARELERAVKEAGAIGGVVSANIEGKNLGEFDLDEYWAAACALEVPVFIHPMGAEPTSRTKFFLTQSDHAIHVRHHGYGRVTDRVWRARPLPEAQPDSVARRRYATLPDRTLRLPQCTQ